LDYEVSNNVKDDGHLSEMSKRARYVPMSDRERADIQKQCSSPWKGDETVSK